MDFEDPRVALATLGYTDLLNDRAVPFYGRRRNPFVDREVAQVFTGRRRMAQSSSLRRKRKCASLSNRQRLISTTTAPVRVSTTAAAAAS